MPPTESRVEMNGFAALDSAADRCFQAIKRSVAAPSPDYRHTASFCQKRICEKLFTVPIGIRFGCRRKEKEYRCGFEEYRRDLLRNYDAVQIVDREIILKPRRIPVADSVRSDGKPAGKRFHAFFNLKIPEQIGKRKQHIYRTEYGYVR